MSEIIFEDRKENFVKRKSEFVKTCEWGRYKVDINFAFPLAIVQSAGLNTPVVDRFHCTSSQSQEDNGGDLGSL